MPIKSPQQSKLPVSILAGLGVSLLVVSIANLEIDDPRERLRQRSTRSSQQDVDRSIELPLVVPIVSSELASDRSDRTTTARVAAQQQQPSPLQSAHVTLKEAKVAVKLSQVQLAQARINLTEFRAKHHSTKTLSAQGKVSRQQADNAKAAYELAQLQHKSASIGLQESQAQLVAAQAEVSKLGRKVNPVKPM
jgi:hypothetical protein